MQIKIDGNNKYLKAEVKHNNGKYILNLYIVEVVNVDGVDFVHCPMFGGFQFLLEEGRKSNKKLERYNNMLDSSFMDRIKPLFLNNDRQGLMDIVFNHFAK